jgi:hypothetical protein
MEKELQSILQHPGKVGLTTPCNGVKGPHYVACLPLRAAQVALLATALKKAAHKNVLSMAGGRKQLAAAGFRPVRGPKADEKADEETGKDDEKELEKPPVDGSVKDGQARDAN